MMPAVASAPAVSRSTTTTLAPLLAKATAVARPMPLPAPVISATLPVKSRSMTFLPDQVGRKSAAYSTMPARLRRNALRSSVLLSLPMQPCPGREVGHQIADEAARRLVGKITVRVKFGLRLTDQHFRLVERMHIEKDAAAPQIVLRAGAARHAGGGADDRTRLAGEGLIGRSRRPVDRGLQHP